MQHALSLLHFYSINISFLVSAPKCKVSSAVSRPCSCLSEGPNWLECDGAPAAALCCVTVTRLYWLAAQLVHRQNLIMWIIPSSLKIISDPNFVGNDFLLSIVLWTSGAKLVE